MKFLISTFCLLCPIVDHFNSINVLAYWMPICIRCSPLLFTHTHRPLCNLSHLFRSLPASLFTPWMCVCVCISSNCLKNICDDVRAWTPTPLGTDCIEFFGWQNSMNFAFTCPSNSFLVQIFGPQFRLSSSSSSSLHNFHTTQEDCWQFCMCTLSSKQIYFVHENILIISVDYSFCLFVCMCVCVIPRLLSDTIGFFFTISLLSGFILFVFIMHEVVVFGWLKGPIRSYVFANHQLHSSAIKNELAS